MLEPFTPVNYDTIRKAIDELIRLKSPRIALELYVALKTCRKDGWDGLRYGEVRLDPLVISRELGYDRRNSTRIITQFVSEGMICPVSKGVFMIQRRTPMTHLTDETTLGLSETMTHDDDTHFDQQDDIGSQVDGAAVVQDLPVTESTGVNQYSSPGMTHFMTHLEQSVDAELSETMTHPMTHLSISRISRVIPGDGVAMADGHDPQSEDDDLLPPAIEPAEPTPKPRRSTTARKPRLVSPRPTDMETRIAAREQREKARRIPKAQPSLLDIVRLSPVQGADGFWSLVQEWPKGGLQRKRTALIRWLEALGSGVAPETILEAARRAIRDSAGRVTRLDIWLEERGYEEQEIPIVAKQYKMKELEFA